MSDRRDTAEQRARAIVGFIESLKCADSDCESCRAARADAISEVLALAAENARLRQERDEWRDTCEVLEDGTGARLIAAERDELREALWLACVDMAGTPVEATALHDGYLRAALEDSER